MGERSESRAEIGSRIKVLRLSQELKLQDLANEAGLSVGHLSDAERGQSALSGEKFASLAEVLGVTTDYLLSGGDRRETSDQSEIAIPKALSEAAVILDLSHEHTIRLLQGRRSIVARRSQVEEREWTKDKWIAFHNNVKDYL